jgi:hypothetical protein
LPENVVFLSKPCGGQKIADLISSIMTDIGLRNSVLSN